MTIQYFLVCYLPAALFALIAASIFILEGFLLVCKIRRHRPPKLFTPKRIAVLHLLAVAELACLVWGYFFEPYRLQISRITIPTPKLAAVSFRIVQISDLHCDKKARLEPRLPEEINRLQPDLIVFTGDALNHPSALPRFQQTLLAMQAALGKFAVRGNVDNRLAKDLPLFENTGFVELSLDSVVIEKNGESISLCGIDDAYGPRSRQALQSLQPDRFNILLFHKTDLADYLQSIPVDLYLCGHTHGGQIALPFYGALITQSRHLKKYEAGLYRKDHFLIYVNRGIGMTGGRAPRLRFLAPPEIAVFDIVPQTPESPDNTGKSSIPQTPGVRN